VRIIQCIGFSGLFWFDDNPIGVAFDDINFIEYVSDITDRHISKLSDNKIVELFFDWFEEDIEKELNG